MITTPTTRAAYTLAKRLSREMPGYPVVVLKRATGTRRGVMIFPTSITHFTQPPNGWKVDLTVTSR